MEAFRQALVQYPVLALFLTIGLGWLLGEISIFGFRLGVAGVLFAGLAVGALHPQIALPEIIPSLGLVIFVYIVGLQSGPALVRTIKERGYKDTFFVIGLMVFGAGLAFAAAWVLKLTGAGAAGLFCGALTTTPGLAAAREAVRDIAGKSGFPAAQIKALADQPVVSYSIAYPIGVMGVLLSFQLFRRIWGVKPAQDERAKPIEVRSFVVNNPEVEGETVASLTSAADSGFAVSRIHRGGRTEVATPGTRLELGTVVTVVGDPDAHAEAEELFGEPSSMQLQSDNSRIVYRRMIVSSDHVVGRTIGELELDKFPATITRVRRGDIETVATPDTQLEHGDMVRVLAYRNKMPDVRKFFGDSVRGAAEAHFGAIALGMVLGVLIGMIPVPLPGGATLRLGYAGGPLVVGLFLGKFGRTGRINWVIPASAAISLRQIGLLLFCAGIGTRAGWEFVRTLQSNGLPMMLGGAVVTMAVTMATLYFGYKVLKMPYDYVTGLMSGIQTQSACVAFASAQAKNSQPEVAYSAVYPVAIVTKIILAQLLVSALPLARAADNPPPTPDGGLDPVKKEEPAKPAKRAPLAKLIRPGVNGVAALPPVHGCLLVENWSREANAAGVQTTGMTGFFECTVAKHIGIWVAPGHWTYNRGVSGFGDTWVGPKFTLNTEGRIMPLVAVGYSYKAPTATHNLGSGYVDHKAFVYADKNFGDKRVTANFATRWEGHKDYFVRQYIESLALLTPIHGKLGAALQTYYSHSELNKYGGAIAAAVYSFQPTLSVHGGLEHGFGPKSADLGLVWGVNYVFHPTARR